jgi:hypothetical protein
MTIKQLYRCSTTSNLGSVSKVYAKGVGAATSDLTGVKGVASIVRGGGAGIHTITLDRKFKSLLMFAYSVIDTGTVDDWTVVPTADLATGNTIAIQVFKGGTAADLPTTATLLMEITLGDTAALPAR